MCARPAGRERRRVEVTFSRFVGRVALLPVGIFTRKFVTLFSVTGRGRGGLWHNRVVLPSEKKNNAVVS